MSDLLNKASLVVIPSGYKEDTVYSVVPSDGSGDLSFTRASNGTRVNSAGLVEVCPWNLLQQSNTFNTTWAFSGTGTVTSGATDPFGGTSAWTLAKTAANTFIYQSTAGLLDSITFSIYAKSGSVDQLHLRHDQTTVFSAYFDLTNGTIIAETNCIASIVSVGGGWFLCSIIGTVATPNNIRIYPASAGSISGSTGNILIYGSQANQGALKPYFPTTDRLNVPRLTYQNGGGGCPSLLLEKQSTNIALYSEQFDNSAYTKRNSTISANATTSPDGTTNADKIQEDTSNDRHDIYQGWACTNGVTYTQTIFAKQGERRYCFMSFGTAILNASDTFFDLQDGVVVSSPSGVTSAIQNMGNGWFRCSITTTCSGDGTGYYVNGPAITSSNYIYQGVSGYGIYVWGCQIEASSYVTSYIYTTSASATRVADACSKTGISSLIGQTEGVFFADYNYTPHSSNYEVAMSLQGATTASFFEIYYSPNNQLNVNIYNTGIQAGYTSSAQSSGRYKVAFAYKTNDFVLYVNGTQVMTDSSGTVPTLSQLAIGYDIASGLYQFSNSVNQAILFPTRLTNAELASLTTL